MEEVEQICSRIVIMDKGRNLANGTATELKQLIKKKRNFNRRNFRADRYTTWGCPQA